MTLPPNCLKNLVKCKDTECNTIQCREDKLVGLIRDILVLSDLNTDSIIRVLGRVHGRYDRKGLTKMDREKMSTKGTMFTS